MLNDKSITELDNLFAHEECNPIRSAEVMTETLVTEPMDKEWKDSISDSKFWATGYKGNIPDEALPVLLLRNKLLSFGGEEACMPYKEEDLGSIMSRGQLWYGRDAIFMEGEPSQCHFNTSALFEANKDKVLIATGYALSKDGMWRQHSWGMYYYQEEVAVVETTEPRVAYFGFVMTEKESEKFAEENGL